MIDAYGQSPNDYPDDFMELRDSWKDEYDPVAEDAWCELCGHTFPQGSLSVVDHEDGGSCYACRDCALDLAPVAPRRLEP